MMTNRDTGSQLTTCPIVGYYDKQRVVQFNPTDCANWVLIDSDLAKNNFPAMYPAMGRRRIVYLNSTKLQFQSQPREAFRTVDYAYFVVNNLIYRVDKYFNQVEITNGLLATNSGDMYADYLVVGSNTYVGFCDGQNLYIYQENPPDGNTQPLFGIAGGTTFPPPNKPTLIATFGNRFVVVGENTAQYFLTEVNLTASTYDINNIFNVANNYVFASEVGIIRQLGVYQNTLYIFTDFKTGLWSNRPSTLVSAGQTVTSFPFQRNTTTEFDRGIADPKTLDVAFDRMTWVSKSIKGNIEAVTVMGNQPVSINTKAIDVLFQKAEDYQELGSPFLTQRLSGFMYEYENSIFYRLNAGNWSKKITDGQKNPLAASIEFNFNQQKWSRCIEKDGQRNRAQRMIHFANRNLVTVQGDSTVYDFTGSVYTNEKRNPLQSDISAIDAYIVEPFRYERITPIITIKNLNQIGYAEFETEYVEIDFAWGLYTSRMQNAPYQNAVFIVDETSTDDAPLFISTENDPNQLLITENSNLPSLTDETYYNWYKPHIELLYSDNGGISYTSADVMRFSDLGVYEWRMRWYNLGSSRSRCYKLYIVSASPMFVLGACMKVKRISGGAD